MTIETLIGNISKMHDNLTRGSGIYISDRNMDVFAEQLPAVDVLEGVLITPYLIANNGGLYELHYYEFDIEVRNSKSHYIEFNPRNTLPNEITENLKPQAIIAIEDRSFYAEAVEQYLANMRKMEFKEDKERHPELQNARLFYQIFIDSDLS